MDEPAHAAQKRCSARSGWAYAYLSLDIPIRRSLESHGDVAGVPATLRRGHVYDQAPVEGLERQKRSDERTVVASHVKDVAPENGSTTSRHAERNDVVDALRALQSIGDTRGESPFSCHDL